MAPALHSNHCHGAHGVGLARPRPDPGTGGTADCCWQPLPTSLPWPWSKTLQRHQDRFCGGGRGLPEGIFWRLVAISGSQGGQAGLRKRSRVQGTARVTPPLLSRTVTSLLLSKATPGLGRSSPWVNFWTGSSWTILRSPGRPPSFHPPGLVAPPTSPQSPPQLVLRWPEGISTGVSERGQTGVGQLAPPSPSGGWGRGAFSSRDGC